MNTESSIRLLAISGSIRRESYCTAVLNTVATAVSAPITVSVFPLNDVPLYNADLDGDQPPASVQALKQAIGAADGLIVCSPEFNYGMPGVLKNAFDWASRPGFKSPLVDKPALIMTASPGTAGGVRAQYQIRDVLSATLARPLSRQHIAIPGVKDKIVEGRLVDEVTLQFVLAGVADLAKEATWLARRRQA